MWCEQQCITSSLCRMQTDEAVVLARHRSISERDMLQSTCGDLECPAETGSMLAGPSSLSGS